MAKGRKAPEAAPESNHEREARHMRWIQENGDKFAVEARKAYETEGRGAFVSTPERSSPRGTEVAYISDRVARETGIGWPGNVAAKMVETYDPAQQFVVIIVEADQRVSAYRVRAVDLSLN